MKLKNKTNIFVSKGGKLFIIVPQDIFTAEELASLIRLVKGADDVKQGGFPNT